MQCYGKEQAIDRINKLASRGKAFVFIINYAQDKAYIEEPDAINPHEMLYNLNGFTNAVPVMKYPGTVLWQPNFVSFAEYKKAFDCVIRNIHEGNSFLVNLTFATPVTTNLSLPDIFHHTKALYKLWLKDRFVVFSPEIFVRIVNGYISSFPMKGTIDASLPDACKTLLSDPKETAEHATITDLIRNDLSIVANNVSVVRYRYLDELETNSGRLLQASSEIGGQLPANYVSRIGNILYQLLPAGSITGAPKCKTVAIINEAETYQRGFYTGITGYYDGKNLDSAVMIRYVEQDNNQLIFKSGGGITARSCAKSEYNEMKQKVYVPIY